MIWSDDNLSKDGKNHVKSLPTVSSGMSLIFWSILLQLLPNTPSLHSDFHSSLVLPNAVLEIAIPLCHGPGKGSMDLIAVYCGPAETRRIMAVYIPLYIYTLFLSLTLSKPCNQALFHAFAEGVPCLLTCRQCRRLKDHGPQCFPWP